MLWAASVGAQGAPTQDNELVLGASLGGYVFPERDARDDTQRVWRVGGAAEATVGLMNRARDWLDGELMLGLAVLWADGGLRQRDGVREVRRAALPGLTLRGGLHAHVARWRVGLGGGAQIFAAPAVGAATRLVVEASTGLELSRDKDSHGALDLVADYAFSDGLAHEAGMAQVNPGVRLCVRLEWGF